MTADDFAKIVRHGNDKLRVDDITILTTDREIHGKGMLRVGRERIDIDVTVHNDDNLPARRGGIFTKRDSWKLTGVIEDDLQFRCDHVAPVGNEQWFNGRTRINLKLKPIELVPAGWDAMTRTERSALQQPNVQNENEQASNATATAAPGTDEPESIEFHASLVDFPLLLTNSVTSALEGSEFLSVTNGLRDSAFLGEMDGYDFALIQKKDNEDMHVHMRSKKGFVSSGECEDWKKFYALMRALAFTHGVHAWPYRIEYWCDGRKVGDRITDAAPLARTSHAPFTDRLVFDAITGERKWDPVETLKKCIAFFETDSQVSEEIAEILFLFREADNGVHSEITTLAMCALFENLMHVIFNELNLKEKELNTNPDLHAFEKAKCLVCEHVDEQVSKIRSEKDTNYKAASDLIAYTRLANLVRSAAPFSSREICQAISKHLGLPWENDMERAFNIWKNARNPLMHRRERARQSEDELKESLLNESRVAGTSNILILKLLGYSGWLRSSAFEDAYRQI